MGYNRAHVKFQLDNAKREGQVQVAHRINKHVELLKRGLPDIAPCIYIIRSVH